MVIWFSAFAASAYPVLGYLQLEPISYMIQDIQMHPKNNFFHQQILLHLPKRCRLKKDFLHKNCVHMGQIEDPNNRKSASVYAKQAQRQGSR